jgi:TonB family protein
VVCLAASALLNLAPYVAHWWIPMGGGGAPPPPPETITYLELQDPEVEEPETPKPPEPELDKPKPKKKKLEIPKKEIEFEELPEPEPEKEKEPEPEPEPEEPKEKIDFVLEQLKMVEQPDELDEKDAPEDHDYLSNINRDVEEQTRSAITNLEKDALKPKASQKEPTKETKPGTANEEKIAKTQEKPSQLNNSSPPSPAAPKELRPEQTDPKPKSLLAMRETDHRDHVAAQDDEKALAAEALDGTLQREKKQQASIAPQERQARIDKRDRVYAFRPRTKDLEALFGKDLVAPQRAEHAKESKTKGVWAGVREHYQSPLENMVSEVKVGNQTALRSRKHPFARFIAQMHREIHDAWAWGFLEQLDTSGRQHPLNDYELWTRVEIVLNRDGTIDKVNTVRHSGKIAFDAAAREIVHAAGPFPDPPREILSGNGKIYIHWAFHRDERACGTFGAQPFILDNAGQGDRPDPGIEVKGGRTESESLGRRLQRKPTAPAVAEGPARPEAHDHDHAHGEGDGHDHGGGGEAPPTGTTEGDGATPPPVAKPEAGGEASVDDPDAKKTANEWLHYMSKGEIDRTLARSSLPFAAGDQVAARTREELKDVLSTMSQEAKAAGRPKAAKLYTAAGLRKVFGSVPSGVQEGGNHLYALTKVGNDYVILVLEKKFGTWRVVGVTR